MTMRNFLTPSLGSLLVAWALLPVLVHEQWVSPAQLGDARVWWPIWNAIQLEDERDLFMR